MKKELDEKKWNRIVILSIILILLLIALATIVIDPFLHYHKPLEGLEYPLKEERYINDGLARHYEYSAIITGSSTSQNFKASQFEKNWGVKTIKMTYAGGTFAEVNGGIERAFSYNNDIRYVLRGLDGKQINVAKDAFYYDGIPTYLYDRNPFNDVYYLLNKDVMVKTAAVINYTRSGQKTTTMDDYAAWYPYATYGRENVLAGLIDYSSFTEEYQLSEQDKTNITENVRTNLLQVALDHPKTEFLMFYSPASGAYWYGMVESKQLHAQLEAEKMCTEILLEAPNIRVFGFANHDEMTTDLDNYMDTLHFSEKISENILDWIYAGEGELTKDNYEEYYRRVETLYSNYEFDYETDTAAEGE